MDTWLTIIISSGGSKKNTHTAAYNLNDIKYKWKSGFCFWFAKVWWLKKSLKTNENYTPPLNDFFCNYLSFWPCSPYACSPLHVVNDCALAMCSLLVICIKFFFFCKCCQNFFLTEFFLSFVTALRTLLQRYNSFYAHQLLTI